MMAKSFEEALADLRAAVEFNRKVIADNPPIETGAWNDAFQWVMNAAHHLAEAEAPAVPDGWKLVPVEPTEKMVIDGFESAPDESFSKPEEWEAYEAMSGCQQAAHRAKLCYAAMLAAAPEKPQ
ncbi:hypothetical protein [Pantoea septica]|uniref:hypothetical protein n=1 Tax=Pantoea septica TaxID=472695 RepID=UPI00289FF7C1|nr:hypothetical protein [Pantoea septica]